MELLIQQGSHNLFNHKFACGDDYQLFEYNLKSMPNDWIWRTKKINYTLNSQFYRAPEWKDIKWNDSYLFFGCSFVFGIGIDDKDTSSFHLSNMLNAPVINLGMPASNPTVQWINSTILVKNNIKPKGVIYLWPSINRTSRFADEHCVVNYGLEWRNEFTFRDWANDIVHCVNYTKHLIDNVNIIWQCPTYHFHPHKDTCKYFEMFNFLKMPYDYHEDHARDVTKSKRHHPGPKTNYFWAQEIFKKIKNN